MLTGISKLGLNNTFAVAMGQHARPDHLSASCIFIVMRNSILRASPV
jgi:hypothetical protein